MSSTKRTFYKCGHHAHGVLCHRCALAEKLEKMIERGELYITNKKSEKPRTWTKKEMAEEAKRLRGPQEHKKNKSGYTKSKSSMSLADQMTENENKTTEENV